MLGQSQIQAISLVHKVMYSVLLLTVMLFFNDIIIFAIFILIFENVFICLSWVLVTTRGIFDLQLRQVGSSSLTWDRTQAPCLGSMESFLATGSTGKSQQICFLRLGSCHNHGLTRRQRTKHCCQLITLELRPFMFI